MNLKNKIKYLDKEIAYLYENERWQECEGLIREAISFEPKSFWYWTKLSSVAYEQYKYTEAKKYSEKALSFHPESPLVWWNFAGPLYMLDEDERAIQLWQNIIDLGIDDIGLVRTTEGKKWAAKLINDSYFMISKVSTFNENYSVAKKYLQRYLKQIKKGVDSRYDKENVNKLKNKIDKNLNHD